MLGKKHVRQLFSLSTLSRKEIRPRRSNQQRSYIIVPKRTRETRMTTKATHFRHQWRFSASVREQTTNIFRKKTCCRRQGGTKATATRRTRSSGRTVASSATTRLLDWVGSCAKPTTKTNNTPNLGLRKSIQQNTLFVLRCCFPGKRDITTSKATSQTHLWMLDTKTCSNRAFFSSMQVIKNSQY